jgi:serine/threonine protein kinase
MLRALNELHGHNVVHLDVKPDNILRTFQGRFKLGDLGLCRTATLNYGEDINEGDSKYMAREILNNFN